MNIRLACLTLPLALSLSLAMSISAQPLTPEKPTSFSAAATQTLASFFDSLSTLLHNISDQLALSQSLSSLLNAALTLVAQTSDLENSELAALKEDCHRTIDKAIQAITEDTDYKRPKDKDKEKETDKEKDPQTAAKTEAALFNVATIASGVAHIVQDPHNKETIGQGIGSILSGIINIALIASHHRSSQQETLACYQSLLEVLHE